MPSLPRNLNVADVGSTPSTATFRHEAAGARINKEPATMASCFGGTTHAVAIGSGLDELPVLRRIPAVLRNQ